MAKSVAELIVAFKVNGVEGVNALKGSLRQLSQASKLSDKDIEALSSGIKNYTRVVGVSEKAIRGQITALKGAREQAQIGGKAYNDLSRDIERYEKRLKSVGRTSEESGKKVATAAQLLAQFPARKPSAFNLQINQLNKDLADLKINTDAYVLQLRKIQEREDSFRQAQARQSVIGRAQTASGGVVDPRAIIKIDAALPKTTAALSLKISELKENLQNLDFTSDKYRDTQREILSVEKQLEAIGKKRIEVIKGVTDQQRRAEQITERSRGRKQRLRANQAQTIAEDAASLAARRALPGPPVREISGLYQSIGDVGMSKISADIDRMGKSYTEVANDIKRATLASNGSIKSLQAQSASWRSLRAGLDPASKGYRKIGLEIDRVDKKLAKLSKTSRFTKGQLLQGAGAVASAGIFGGPLGALGGLLGFVGGGPAGAAVGGGIGASANILVDYGRQIAELNTQLNLSKQTLALAANGQEEYNKLLGIARNISKDYAVGLKETIGGFSQVAVAARANNLTLKETETIYRGLVSSGIAFGKSQQDIDAIVRATVQVLSKGKLSAEELQGQIGERLPGAVAKFAEATGRTLPQLAKDLKAGTVEISDFVDFSKEQLFDYDKVAQLIADGPEKAGARLKLALEEAAENYGGFFQSTGAGFQDLGTFIVTFFNDNQEIIETFVVDSIIAFKNLALEVKLAFEDIKETLGFFKPVLDAFDLGIQTISKANRRQRALEAGGFDDQEFREKAEKFARENIETGSEYKQPLEFNRIFRLKFNELKGDAVRRGETILREQTGDTVEGREQLREQLFGEFKPYSMGQYKPGGGTGGTGGTGDTGGTGGTGGTGIDRTQIRIDRADEIVRKLQDQLKIQEAQSKVGQLIAKQEKERSDLEAKFQDLLKDGANGRISAASEKADGLLLDKQALELQARTKQLMDEATKPLEDMNTKLREKISFDKEYQRLISEGINPELANQLIEINKIFAAGDKKLEQQILDLEAEKLKTGLGKEQLQNINEQIEAIKRRREAEAGKKEDAEEAAGEVYADPSFMDTLREKMKTLYDEATNLNEQIANVGVRAVSSFADAFVELAITGKSSFKELTVSILQDLAKIIMRAAILKAFKLIVPGLFAADGAVTQGATPVKAANGLAVAKNGIVPYAKGGLVTKPTLFQYKQGGVGNYGLMGEAGTEAILPLRRGPGGRLGVESSGGVGNVVVNVDASGSSVEGDSEQAGQLGKMLGAVVQAELIKQKRPGGLLA